MFCCTIGVPIALQVVHTEQNIHKQVAPQKLHPQLHIAAPTWKITCPSFQATFLLTPEKSLLFWSVSERGA